MKVYIETETITRAWRDELGQHTNTEITRETVYEGSDDIKVAIGIMNGLLPSLTKEWDVESFMAASRPEQYIGKKKQTVGWIEENPSETLADLFPCTDD